MKRNAVELQSLLDVRKKTCAAVEAAMQNHLELKNYPQKNNFNIMKKIALFRKNIHARVYSPLFCLLTLAFLLGTASIVCGQELDEVTWKTRPADVNDLPEWNGTEKNGTYKVSVSRTIPGRVVLDGTLTLYPVGNVTITRGEFYYSGQCVFEVNGGKKLFIIGDADNILTMNGGAGNRDDGLPGMGIWSEYYGRFGPAVACHDDAEAWLQHVIIEKFAVVGNEIYNRWGVISCTNNKLDINDPSTLIVRMKNVEMRKCYGGTKNIHHFEGSGQNWNSFGRVFSILVGKNDVFMENVEIHHNLLHEDEDNGWFMVYDRISGMGGIIRSQGNSSGKMVLKNCYIHDNQYRDLDAHAVEDYWNNTYKVEDQPLAGQGGAINWRSGRNYTNSWDGPLIESELIIRNCTIVRNCAKEGGAISTCAKTTFKKDGDGYTYISKNHAVNGGGLMFWPYNDGQLSYAGDGFNVTLGGEGFNNNGSAYVRVFDNYASQTGGGAYIVIDPTDDVGFDTDNNPRDASYVANFGTGCAIKNNRAPQGAGVAIIDNAAKRHVGYRATTPDNYTYQMINPVRFKVSGELSREITIDGAHICDNYTSTEGTFPDKAEGAGIYIAKRNSKDPRFKADFKTDTIVGGFTETISSYVQTGPSSYTYPIQTITPYENDEDPGGTMTVNVLSGDISNNHARRYNLTIGNLNQNSYSPFTDTEVTDDPRPGNGGGFHIASLYDLENFVSELNVNIGAVGKTLEVYNNDAYTDGGGVYVHYDRTDGRVNQGMVTVRNGTIGMTDHPTANKALNGNGGGLCVLGGTVHVEGGHIDYNTASNGLGGGVYVSVPNKESMTLIHGGAVISYNSATGGGGIYVDKGELDVIGDMWNPDANSGAGAWELVDWSGGTYDPTAEATHTRIIHNTATNGNGGGIDAGNGEVDITNTLIYYNSAAGTVSKGRGGGVYLDGGTIKIYNSKILNNTAETNGGGIDDHSGDIEIYGGDISHNTATNGRGGGIYTNAGDIRIWPTVLYGNPVPAPSLEACKNTGTLFSYNTAGTNGGGLNTHIGRLDVRFAKVHHNVAGHNYTTIGTQGGSGGGMFCEGPHADLSGYTVRLIHTLLNYNKAYGNGGSDDNLTGRGGGLYLKYGSIFAEHCNILGNKADINGGGLDNHDGELRVYGSIIGKSLEETMPEDCKTEDDDENGNRAISGRGGGIYTDKGNLVVGPCDSYGFTSSKACSICNNTAYLNGGGVNNHEGNITIHGDRINNNTATTGKGGGVYINSGNIYMYGGQINNNHADDPSGGYGGGVYGGGGTFEIKEREAHPILEILEVENILSNGFIVHFHHVDRGFAMESGATNKEYGIAFSTRPYPTDLGENVDWTGHWDDVTKIRFAPSAGQLTPPDPHSYNQNEGCSRFVVNSTTSGITINPNTTYYVVAYGKYTYGGKNYFDASPAVTVKTHGNEPVVVAGVDFDVTANSASVNAKLFYNGIGEVTVTSKGFQLSTDGGSTWGPQRESLSVGDVFSYTFEGLSANTSYMARAYATNSAGHTGYSEGIIQFTTSSGSKAMDAAGKLPRSVYPEVEKNPFFQELTPLQQAVLANTPEEDTTTRRSRNGRPSDEEPVNIPQINNNTATYGGGVCIDKQGARLIFSGKRGEVVEGEEIGQINYNYASEAGGGIYIGYQTEGETPGPAMMQMMGRCHVNANRVPEGKLGGGIYLDGRLYVGDKASDPIGTHGLMVDKNFAINKEQSIFEAEYAAFISGSAEEALEKEYYSAFNNVYLTRYNYDYEVNMTETGDNNISVITLLSDISGYKDAPANKKPYSHIGFHVERGFCPVIATSKGFSQNYDVFNLGSKDDKSNSDSELWLYNLMTMAGSDASGAANSMRGAVFEDTESYVAVHIRVNIEPFLLKFIYLWGCWTHPIVKEDPEKNNPMRGTNTDGTDEGWCGHYKITNPDDNNNNANDDTPLNWEIYSPEGLTWFTAYVNGLNVFDEVVGGGLEEDGSDGNNHFKWNIKKNPRANAKIMNDIDMSAYLWVPIGSVMKFYQNGNEAGSLFMDSDEPASGEYTSGQHYYGGTFDGQGHVIKGLRCFLLTGIEKFGLFGYLADSAVVKNTFVDESLFRGDSKTMAYSVGGIAGEMKRKKASNPAPIISNSEARMSFDASFSASGTKMGGLVGEVKVGEIHSSMAMPDMVGQNLGEGGDDPTFTAFEGCMGGLVGELGSGCDLKNSFSNSGISLVNSDGATVNPAENSRHLGGLVGLNNGTVENCYSRYFGTTTPTGFGWFAGTNNYAETTVGSGDEQTTEITGVIKYCYAPNGETTYIGNNATTGLTGHGNYGPTVLVSGKYGFKHRDQQMTPVDENDAIYITGKTNDTLIGGLMHTLNGWVKQDNAHSSTYSIWTRTMASPINDDYPILVFKDFNSVGSKDKIYMLYEDDINHMWNAPVFNGDVVTIPGKDFAACNTDGSVAAMYLYDVQPDISQQGGNAESKPDDVTITGNIKVPLYINEDIGITQPVGVELTARAGVTIRNARKGGDDFTADPNWHLFSSAIKDVPIGLEYHTTEEGYEGVANYQVLLNFRQAMETPTLNNGGGIPNTDYWNRNYMDPPKTTWSESNVGYFPTNTPYGTWRDRDCNHSTNVNDNGVGGFFDLYSYSEEYYHWVNFKREGKEGFYDHWHMDGSDDGSHEVLTYKNESAMPNGKGYMMALSSESMMMADGQLNTGDIYSPVTLTAVGTNNPRPWRRYDEPWRTLNMIGNPYQSYLDFDAFASSNSDILSNPAMYATRDDNGYKFIYYCNGQSENPYSAKQYIHPHQGFFVKVKKSDNVTFNDQMRKGGTSTTLDSPFRGQLNYPLVNLLCFDGNGDRDLITVEINRPELGGGDKMKNLHAGNALLYSHFEGNDYQTLFAPVGVNVVPVRFEVLEDGIFTMRWNTYHGDFSYLHLIDNLAGVDLNLLTHDEYRFEGKKEDYVSRFKLVFRCDNDDPDEPEEPDDGEDADHFAFMFGDELIVNGEGMLQMFDVQGRCLMTTHVVGGQSSVSLPKVACGVYLLRLIGNDKVKIQKMVIK